MTVKERAAVYTITYREVFDRVMEAHTKYGISAFDASRNAHYAALDILKRADPYLGRFPATETE